MSLDRIKQTTFVVGTGPVALPPGAAPGGFRPFLGAVAPGQALTCCIVDQVTFDFEVSQCVFQSGGIGGELVRGAVLASSNANIPVTFAGNACDVFATTSASAAPVAAGGNLVSVAAFGAAGDGLTDDTAALQAALLACAGSTALLVPAAMTCLVSQALLVPSGTILTLDGTIRSMPNAGTLHSTLNLAGSDILIQGVGCIDGNRAAQTGTAGGSAGIGSGQAPVSRVRIRDIEIKNVPNWPINITIGASDVRVEDCTMHDSGNSCEFNLSSDCHFTGNTVFNIGDGGVVLYAGDGTSSVSGNVIHDCIGGVGIYSDPAQPAMNANCVVRGNIVYNIRDYGLAVEGVLGAQLQRWCTIEGNMLFNNGAGGTGGTGSIHVTNVSGVTVRGNFIHGDAGNHPYPIGVIGPFSNVEIAGNTITDCGVPGGPGTFGIALVSNGTTPTDVVVRGNTVTDTRGAASATAFAIYADGLGAGCSVTDNVLLGTFTSANPIQFVPLDPRAVLEGYLAPNNNTGTRTVPSLTVQALAIAGFHAWPSFANDAQAAAGGVPVDQVYRNGSTPQVRVA